MRWHLFDWNNIMKNLRERIESVDPFEAEGLLVFNDVRGTARELIKTFQKVKDKGPIYVLQHGRAATRDYDKPCSFPLIADKFLAWGQSDKDRMTRLGYGARTEIVGCPLLEQIKPKVPHDSKDVLFIPVNTDHEEPHNLLVYYELLRIRYAAASRYMKMNLGALHNHWGIDGKANIPYHSISGFNLIAKVLPRHDKNLYHGDVVQSNPLTPTHSEVIFDLLANVDCVVTLDESTTEILTMACDVPVVCCDIYEFDTLGKKDYRGVERVKTKGAAYCNLETLEDAVMEALYEPQKLRDQRADVVEEELTASIKSPTERILEVMGEKVLA